MRHIGQEVEFTALGKTWRAARFARSVWKKFAAWARTKLTNPLASALDHVDAASAADERALRRILAADQEETKLAAIEGRQALILANRWTPIANDLVTRAQEEALLLKDIYSPAIQAVAMSIEGQEYQLFLLLQANHPAITLAEVEAICDELTAKDINAIIKGAEGERPAPKNDLDPGDSGSTRSPTEAPSIGTASTAA